MKKRSSKLARGVPDIIEEPLRVIGAPDKPVRRRGQKQTRKKRSAGRRTAKKSSR